MFTKSKRNYEAFNERRCENFSFVWSDRDVSMAEYDSGKMVDVKSVVVGQLNE